MINTLNSNNLYKKARVNPSFKHRVSLKLHRYISKLGIATLYLASLATGFTNMATLRCCENRTVLMEFDMDSNKFRNYISVYFYI